MTIELTDWKQYQVSIPEGQSGQWGVEIFEAKPNLVQEIRCSMDGRHYVPGQYTRLVYGRNHNVIMSDTPDEIMDHMAPIERASGRILINGLGLGMVVKAVLANPNVTSVDVVENVRTITPSLCMTFSMETV